MKKICFPHYLKGEFASLAEALKFLTKSKDTSFLSCYMLCEIVQYNVCYRDHLRQYGIEDLIERLIEEAPLLNENKMLLDYLRDWASTEKLADYDIQCYNIKDRVTILGHTFNGLKDICGHAELFGFDGYNELHCFAPNEIEQYDDVHVGQIYENYPVFDISDYSDNRTYQNYIFRTAPITENDMNEAFETFHGFNFCMVHEGIPEEMLPILYYGGDGKYMLLATAKSS